MTDPPVQSQFGWHIIRLDDERATKVPVTTRSSRSCSR